MTQQTHTYRLTVTTQQSLPEPGITSVHLLIILTLHRGVVLVGIIK